MLMDWLAAAVIGALVFAWLGHAFLNYDSVYALIWGSDVAHGRTPGYGVAVAPTPHPLTELIGIALTPFGSGGEDLMLAIGLLALGMLAVGLFRLGQRLFGVWAGVLAAAIIVTRVPILSFGIRGYVDLPTAALVVWACVLEVRRPFRGAPVLVLLGLAGLLRPEAWLYAGAYWLWLVTKAPKPEMDAEFSSAAVADARRTQIVRWTALALAAPAFWMLSDLLVTGNPVHSLTGTQDLAAELKRKTGITALPEVGPRRLGEILRLPEAIAALAGLGFALKWMRDRAHLPLVVAILNGTAYTAFAIAGLPLLGRYLFVGASLLAVFAGAGVFGWRALPPEHAGRRLWRPVGIAALAAIVVFFPLQQLDRLDVMKDDIAARDRIQADLRELVQRPDVETGLRACTRIYVLSHRPIPLIALYADIPSTRIVVPQREARGCAVVPASDAALRLAVLDPNEPVTAAGAYTLGPDSRRNRSWEFAPQATIAAG